MHVQLPARSYDFSFTFLRSVHAAMPMEADGLVGSCGTSTWSHPPANLSRSAINMSTVELPRGRCGGQIRLLKHLPAIMTGAGYQTGYKPDVQHWSWEHKQRITISPRIVERVPQQLVHWLERKLCQKRKFQCPQTLVHSHRGIFKSYFAPRTE